MMDFVSQMMNFVLKMMNSVKIITEGKQGSQMYLLYQGNPMVTIKGQLNM